MTQLPLIHVLSEWAPPELGDLPSWAGARRVAVDVETHDPQLKALGPGDLRDGYLVGVSFAVEDGPSFYLPVRHQGGDNLPEAQVLRYLRDQAGAFSGTVVGANLPYDLGFLWREGIEFSAAQWFRDVQVADPVIYELHAHYDLESVATRWGLPGKDQSLLQAAAKAYGVDPKDGLWRLPARYVGQYAARDAQLPLAVLRRQEKEIDELDLWETYDLESRLLPALVRMRRRGVRVDEAALDRFEAVVLERERAALVEVHRLTGVFVTSDDLSKKEAVARALKAVGVELKATATGQPQIDRALLKAAGHPAAAALLTAKACNKARTTFVASIRRHAVGGRVHSTMNQLRGHREDGTESGARFGRMSCQHPNLQQQLARDKELAKLWRSIFVPEDGRRWLSADFSQQEPRWVVHYAELCDLRGAREAADRYRRDPTTDQHQMMADLCGIRRDPAKTIFLGLTYGMGGAKLARSLGLPTRWTTNGKRLEVAGEEAQALLDKFNERVPYVHELARLCQRTAARRGYVVILYGFRCHFPQRPDGTYDWVHKAINRLGQGSAAYQTKKAVVDVDAAGHFLQLQVHDELGLSVESDDEAKAVGEIMERGVLMRVPSKVDLEVGPSWGEAEKL